MLHRVHPEFPVVIAANRDEFYARIAEPPQILRRAPLIAGGRDREKGGTWFAIARTGALAAITNQRAWYPPPKAPRSRGEIPIALLDDVADAPASERQRAAREHLERLDPAQRDSFNLLFADPGGVQLAYGRRESRSLEIEPLPTGVFVLANDRLGSPSFPKTRRARDLIAPAATAPWDQLASRLARALSDHELPPADAIETPPPGSPFTSEIARQLQAICIHTARYGTRSATITALHPDGVAHYAYADGPPCEATFSDASHLIAR